MLKIFFVIMLLTPGMTEPVVKKDQVESYQACLDEVAKIKEVAERKNSEGHAFKVLAGCEFQSDKSDPT